MKVLATGDLHFTDAPEDDYRFEIFDWLLAKADQYDASAVAILGDITDHKDHHSSALVNRIVDGIVRLRDEGGLEVHILKGNHDYTEEANPYLRFLHTLRPEKIHFYNEPTWVAMGKSFALFLPSTHHYRRDWKDLDFSQADLLFAHQTFNGAVAANGFALDGGVPLAAVSKEKVAGVCISGDIHVPQALGNVVYTGAPYPVRFGDTYEPRVLLVDCDKKSYKSIERTTIRKAKKSVEGWESSHLEEFQEGDQVRLDVVLTREEYATWPDLSNTILAQFAAKGIRVASLTASMATDHEVQEVQAEAHSPQDGLDAKELVQVFGNTYSVPLPVIDAGTIIVEDIK